MAYRVPRRFIVPPEEPPPYGLFLLSFLGHAFFFMMAGALSAYVSSQIDESKIYIVNLVPATAPLGSPTPRVVESPRRVEERTPPKTLEAPRPKETPPPKPEKAEAPRPKETPPPKPEKAPEKVPEKAPEKVELPRPKETPPPRPELPPRAPEAPRTVPPRPTELALPRKAERELAALDRTPLPETRPVTPPPATPPPARVAEPPRTPEPPRALPTPAPTPPAPPPTAAVRLGPDPVRPGRPDASPTTSGPISLDVSDFPFTYYLRQLQSKISQSWAPPRAATAGGERAIVVFEIGRDGQIKEPAVERSSGNAIYDQSALRAVMEASPFPPLPPEFRAPSLRVHFGFEFRPEQG